MKNAKELLKQLEKSDIYKALNHFDADFFEEHKHKEMPVNTPKKALACAFDWGKSKEGYEYWENIHNGL